MNDSYWYGALCMNNDNVEETDKVVKEKDIVDDVMGSTEIRKEQKQIPIPLPTRSPRNVSSSDKIIFKKLTAIVSPTTATTSKIREVLDHFNKVVHDTTFAKTKEMITQEMPRLVNHAVNKDRIPEIFMQQFRFTIKKVKDSESYEFLLANKKCKVDAKVFRKILDICPRVEVEEFTKVQDDDATLTFLTNLGYKGPLHKYTNMYVDYMHQPWTTLAAIINKCLSRKTASNDILRKSRIDIMWGMFYKENIDYLELIWEDFAF
ncbi:hypothetical protein Tco_0319888 [Tanacetum coccineum]